MFLCIILSLSLFDELVQFCTQRSTNPGSSYHVGDANSSLHLFIHFWLPQVLPLQNSMGRLNYYVSISCTSNIWKWICDNLVMDEYNGSFWTSLDTFSSLSLSLSLCLMDWPNFVGKGVQTQSHCVGDANSSLHLSIHSWLPQVLPLQSSMDHSSCTCEHSVHIQYLKVNL